MKFSFGYKIFKLCLYMIEYKANLKYSFYKIFKKPKAHFNIFNAKVQI